MESEIAHQFFDVTELRAVGDTAHDSIPLATGQALLASGRTILRSSATTSRRQRVVIGSQFSTVGDRIASRARMGYTRHGSYVLPILMPISVGDLDRPEMPSFVGTETFRESEERRVTRTMAQALTAIHNRVVTPAVDPPKSVIPDLVVAGATRETVVAIERLVATPEVSGLGIDFRWASAVQAPSGLSRAVTFPAEAAPLLTRTAQLMRSAPKRREEQLSGVIVELRDEPNEKFGEFSLQTVRNGRHCEVRVTVERETLDQAHAWFADNETLIIDGAVESRPGRPLRVPRPESIVPLSDTILLRE